MDKNIIEPDTAKIFWNVSAICAAGSYEKAQVDNRSFTPVQLHIDYS